MEQKIRKHPQVILLLTAVTSWLPARVVPADVQMRGLGTAPLSPRVPCRHVLGQFTERNCVARRKQFLVLTSHLKEGPFSCSYVFWEHLNRSFKACTSFLMLALSWGTHNKNQDRLFF